MSNSLKLQVINMAVRFEIFPILFIVALTLATPSRSQCVQINPNNGANQRSVRDLQSSDPSSHFHVLEQDGQAKLCVETARCIWELSPMPLSELGTFRPYVDGDEYCQAKYDQRRWDLKSRTYFSNCKMTDALSRALSVANQLAINIIGTDTPCGSLSGPLIDRSTIVIVDNVPIFVGSVDVAHLCLAIGLELDGRFRVFAALLRLCPTNAIAANQLAAQWFGSSAAPESKFSIGASFDKGGFGFSTSDPSFNLANTTPFVWGTTINSGYVGEWLLKIREGASRDFPLAAQSSLESSDKKTSVGRLAKWLSAGLLRIDARTFDESDPNWKDSSEARDWMTRTLMTNPNEFSGTLLRAEIARTDWTAP